MHIEIVSVIHGKKSALQIRFAPKVVSSQTYGQLDSYVLHHKTPIYAGGGVYDLNNIAIVTPRMHQEILDKAYHFGN